jgi:hypothetical protein
VTASATLAARVNGAAERAILIRALWRGEMIFDLRAWIARLLPQGPMDLARQLLLIGLSLVAYEHVRTLTASDASVAFVHARELISLERSLHIFVEPSVQAWATGSHLLTDAADWLYLNAQTSIVIGALIYLYRFRNSSFYFVRNTLIISWGIALIGYFVFPSAPPRLLPEWGFVDTVADFTHVHEQTSTVISLINPYDAVPSMHVALARGSAPAAPAGDATAREWPRSDPRVAHQRRILDVLEEIELVARRGATLVVVDPFVAAWLRG